VGVDAAWGLKIDPAAAVFAHVVNASVEPYMRFSARSTISLAIKAKAIRELS
jgi:hypothetical protein